MRAQSTQDETIWHAAVEVVGDAAALGAIEPAWPDELAEAPAGPPTIGIAPGAAPGRARIDIYLTAAPDAAERAALAVALAPLGLDDAAALEFAPLPPTDWVGESQKRLTPVEAGRFVVHGSHDRDRVEKGKTGIEIEAGQAFGTGHHETTRGCLLALDGLAAELEAPPARALDLGTGSGVLAMAAWHLWHLPVFATDIDPVAIETARANIEANGIPLRAPGATGDGIALATSDGFNTAEFKSEQPFDLITANILADPLIRMAPFMAMHCRTGGRLVLSGLTTAQRMQIERVYERAGFGLCHGHDLGGWSTLVMERLQRDKRGLEHLEETKQRVARRLGQESGPAGTRRKE